MSSIAKSIASISVRDTVSPNSAKTNPINSNQADNSAKNKLDPNKRPGIQDDSDERLEGNNQANDENKSWTQAKAEQKDRENKALGLISKIQNKEIREEPNQRQNQFVKQEDIDKAKNNIDRSNEIKGPAHNALEDFKGSLQPAPGFQGSKTNSTQQSTQNANNNIISNNNQANQNLNNSTNTHRIPDTDNLPGYNRQPENLSIGPQVQEVNEPNNENRPNSFKFDDLTKMEKDTL